MKEYTASIHDNASGEMLDPDKFFSIIPVCAETLEDAKTMALRGMLGRTLIAGSKTEPYWTDYGKYSVIRFFSRHIKLTPKVRE